MKKFFLFIIVLVLAGGGFYGYRHYYGSAAKTAAAETLVPVTRGNLEDVITSQGKLEPKEYVDVGVQISGQLKALHVAIGDNVKQGDLLAEIDSQIYTTKVRAGEAQLKTLAAQSAEQQAQITLARQQYERNQRLLQVKAVSQDLMQTSQTALKVAEARLASLKSQIEQAQSTLEGDKTSLGFTKIFAPMSGTVVAQTSREGQTLNANQSAPVIVQLANLDTMTVRAQVAEADVMNLKPEMEVYFTVLGNLQRRWQGKIRQILPTPELVNDVVLYNVLVDVDNSDHQLMSGMTTQMFFVQGKKDNVLQLPISVLTKPVPDKNNATGEAYLLRVSTGKKASEERVVIVGMKNRSQAEIVSGLNENDQIVIAAPPASDAKGAPRGFGPRL